MDTESSPTFRKRTEVSPAASSMTVHILRYGSTLCGFGWGQFPGEWPPGHKWAFPIELKDVTCEGCLEAADGMPIKFVKRDDVKDRLLLKWGDAIDAAKKAGLPYHIPDWPRLRNYELEWLMKDNYGDHGWVVCEWCPFDGIFCSYKEGASRHDLMEAREDIAAVPEDKGLNKSHFFRLIDTEIAKRPADLGDKQRWGQGIVNHLKKREGSKRGAE